MKKILWSIPALAVYFYTATVLSSYGFVHYFGIPHSFIDSSIKENITFFYSLYIIGGAILGAIRWWGWAIIFVSVLIILALIVSSKFFKWYFQLAGIILLFFALMGFFKFGNTFASRTPMFYVPIGDCGVIDSDSDYVIPLINGNGLAVFIPYDKNNNNKMTGGFIARNVAELSCELEPKDIGGPVIK